MADENVTLGEVYRAIVDIRSNMVSKDANEAVIRSLRDAISGQASDISNVRISVAEVDQKSQRRHEKAEADSEARVEKLSARIEAEIMPKFERAEERQFQVEQALKAEREAKVRMYVGVVAGGVVTIITSILIAFFVNGPGAA